MDIQTLKKANDLNQKIKELNEALNCFEWSPEESIAPISTNPRILIEFDGDGREQIKLPLVLSDVLVAILKKEIVTARESALSEFIAL
jgi:hypothetical protein